MLNTEKRSPADVSMDKLYKRRLTYKGEFWIAFIIFVIVVVISLYCTFIPRPIALLFNVTAADFLFGSLYRSLLRKNSETDYICGNKLTYRLIDLLGEISDEDLKDASDEEIRKYVTKILNEDKKKNETMPLTMECQKNILLESVLQQMRSIAQSH